ncbi:hypothetical protein [Streptomyces alfalfae]
MGDTGIDSFTQRVIVSVATAIFVGLIAGLLVLVGGIEVGRRPLSVYDELTGIRPFTTHPSTRETS